MKKWYVILILLCLAGLGSYYYMNYDFRNAIKNTKADYELSSKDLFEAFDADEGAANTKYTGKILEISGSVTDVVTESDQVSISLHTGDMMSVIVCELNKTLSSDEISLKVGDSIKIKGECSGKLIDIILVNCVVIN